MTFQVRMFFASLLFAASSMALAHDPAEHAKEAAAAGKAADCSALDHSAMDPADPVARALMAKCGMQDGDGGAHEGHGSPDAQTKSEPDELSTSPSHHGEH